MRACVYATLISNHPRNSMHLRTFVYYVCCADVVMVMAGAGAAANVVHPHAQNGAEFERLGHVFCVGY